MAGLLYGVRLMIYQTEAQERPEPEKSILTQEYQRIERLLWNIIATPAMLLTLIAGISMLFIIPWIKEGWMHVKLTFVLGLVIYHFLCLRYVKHMRQGIYRWSSIQLRIWNEVATIFLFAIVFLAVLKNAVNWIYGVLGLIIFSLIIMSAVKIYKYFRLKK